MEEKPKITEEQLKQIAEQYWTISETLKDFRTNMRKRSYKKKFDEKQRAAIEYQYGFYKRAINATIRCLVANERLEDKTATDALFNRFVKFSVKVSVIKYIYRHGK